MQVYYLETSALFKRYRTEQGTGILNELFADRRPDEILVTSYFTALEVEAVAARTLKGGVLNREAHRVLLGRFADDVSEAIVLQPISDTILSDSVSLTRRYALRAGDAIHLATASRLSRATATQTIFVTSDKELLHASGGEGFESLNPQEDESGAHLRRLRGET